MRYFEELASLERLQAGWERTAENNGRSGADGVTVYHFSLQADAYLHYLHDALLDGSYRPAPLLRIDIPKPDGGTRSLMIPTVADRVVQSAALDTLQPVFEAEYEACSFAYRPGLSHHDAIEEVEWWREEGYQWVVEADISAFFDEVDHGLMIERLRELVDEPRLITLIQAWLTLPVYFKRRRYVRSRGLPQGSPISPLLANLYLDKLDEALLAEGFKLIRFADDFVVLCKNPDRAEAALELTESILASLKLRLKASKTRVTSFDRGFTFLGSLFMRTLIIPGVRDSDIQLPYRRPEEPLVEPPLPLPDTPDKPEPSPVRTPLPKLPPRPETALALALKEALEEDNLTLESFRATLPGPPVEVPKPAPAPPPVEAPLPAERAPGLPDPMFLRTLYVQRDAALLRVQNERFRVTEGETVLLDVPALHVEQVWVLGGCAVTPSAVRFCLRKGVPVTFSSKRGRYYGRLEAPSKVSVERERAQFTLDELTQLDLAKALVQEKIGNARQLLMRKQRERPETGVAETARALAQANRRVPGLKSLEALRGTEGAASAQYFGVFSRLLRNEQFHFSGRTRRPPLDPVNAMLSFGYTLLYGNAFTVLRHQRLNPYVGILHAERTGHAALASDLMEGFRPLIDRLVVRVVNQRLLNRSHFDFVPADGLDVPACYLNDEGRKRFVGHFERLMATAFRPPDLDRTITYRQALHLQSARLTDAILGRAGYLPFRLL
ncbi:MAG: CRISPR-associated endonuclease Cas1 [Bacteroidota bacterium]